ncbi:50S ribosomal protein L18 [Candidatus Peregrinibacteria bacterium]|jgi:large subunit ribosomal protein L18|nr:50S ribosomal protein L18 [Candidatus Peregrinibacteria bacterium]MBT4147759.1 50S ribosomal protein L18 [Candidatus Peregrinibacteria bacterium]MBT4365930.1 50S ribosomal protein L18 [Candidatus Peregrinibacteria bacterium]MBT4456555.1 50S ribosomal protein L18 [Candidatus Peregrinibacteria bacterium]
MSSEKEKARKARHNRVRSKVKGTAVRPRLVVFRSLKATYAQLVDDESGKTICSSSTLKVKKGPKQEQAKEVGLEIAKKATEQKIKEIVFDRGGYKYHGRVKQIAEGAREGGLKF